MLILQGLASGACINQKGVSWQDFGFEALEGIKDLPLQKIIIFIIFHVIALQVQANQFIDNLNISGSNTLGKNMIPACAHNYLESNGYTHIQQFNTGDSEIQFSARSGETITYINIQAKGSSTGFKAMHKGLADIAMASRPIKDSELTLLKRTMGLNVKRNEHTIAIDGISVIVNKKNPISLLSLTAIQTIFSGKITNWQAFGGPNKTIEVFSRDRHSGTWYLFKKLVLGNDNALTSTATLLPSNGSISSTVASSPWSIGFTDAATVGANKPLALFEGSSRPLKPTDMAIATEDYPLSRRLYLYENPLSKSRHTQPFIDFCQSKKGQSLISSLGFTSQNIIAVKVDNRSSYPEPYYNLVNLGERLSVNFRFTEGESHIDNKALRDLERLSLYYLNDLPPGYELVLVGFTAPLSNDDELISRFRALAVQGKLTSLSIPVSRVLAFGSFLPVANLNTELKRVKNGRVEAWIVPSTALNKIAHTTASQTLEATRVVR